MLDVVVRGGEVVDGTGAPRVRADVAIRDGHVVAVGKVDEPSRRVIDADGRIVAPGFIDVHTHYDAQVCWDPYLTPSIFHGVTTVIGGNCGFTIAPLEPDAAEYLMRLLARVEGMPLETLETGVPWDWRTTEEYYARLEGHVGANVGFKAGHSTIRRIVMGEAATQRKATDIELDAMRAMLGQCLRSGALGFSSSWGGTHRDANGDPVPSRWADVSELVALAEVCGAHAGTALEFVPDLLFDWERAAEAMVAMSAAAKRPLDWNLMRPTASTVDDWLMHLRAGDAAQQAGGRVTALTIPMSTTVRYSFLTGFLLDSVPGWGRPMALPANEKHALLSDPVQRRQLEQLAADAPASLGRYTDWPNRVITETFDPALKRYEGRLVADIAAEEHKSPFDALVDIACADELRTVFCPPVPPMTGDDWAANLRFWRDPRTLIGGTDAGAHLDLLAFFHLQTWFLDEPVRQLGLLGLEEAVWNFTGRPAALYGLRDRGSVAEGSWADLVVFDAETVGAGPVYTRFDLPAGAGRLYADGVGIEHVLVNGVEVAAGNETTGELPGTVLRAGRDTYTPSL
jgi:N-acyl-D-aspartate/D-glutamate deacylase